MDFNDNGANAYNDEANEVVVAVAREQPDLNALQTLKQRIQTCKKSMTDAFLKIETEIEKARKTLPASKVKLFLVSECGLNRSDINTYLKFADALGHHRELVQKKSLPFTLVKSLVAAPEKVRDEAIGRIELGSFVHSSDVSAIKRHFADQLKDPAVERERRRIKVLQAAAERKAQTALESFSAEFIGFAQRLIEFYNDGYDGLARTAEFHKDRDHVVKEAGRCLAGFEAIFDTDSLPSYREYDFHGHLGETVCLARAHESLKSLAAGELKAIDPEDCNPYDKDHDYLDTANVENVIWLFNDNGISADDLKPQRAAMSTPALQTQPPYRLTSVEICAGAGGQALGLHAAGFDAFGLYERNPYAAKTLETNDWWLGPVHCADITQVDFSGYRGDIDLVAGGVPCQPHSSMGNQKGRDDERDLFMEAVRVVEEIQPRAFFFENVQGFGHRGNMGYRADLFEQFAKLGYESQVFSFYGSDYGLAQLRPRVAFIGFRDIPMKRFCMPPKFPEWEKTVGEVLLPVVTSNGWEQEAAEKWAREHANRRGSTIVGASEASGRQSFSANLRTQDWLNMRINPMGITDRAPPPGYVPSEGNEFQFTLEMGARLQGFPPEWRFVGSDRTDKHKKVQRRQIANALPPIMAQAVGLAIYSALTGVEFDYAEALQHPEMPRKRKTGFLSKLSESRRNPADYHRGV